MLIVLPSLVSGFGVLFVLLAIFVGEGVARDVLLAIGVILLWLDFFVTMAIFRHSIRSIDRRLTALEQRRPE